MEMAAIQYPTEKDKLYPLLAAQLRGLIEGVPHKTANLANASALLFDALTQINWAGFYLMKEGQLVLGPFQGKPACIEIAVGRGVCGTAVAQNPACKKCPRISRAHPLRQCFQLGDRGADP